MRPLTRREWEEHYTDLRAPLLKEWPEVDERRLEAANDDFDRVIELIQAATGMSGDEIESRLKALDVEELGLGTGGPGEEQGAEGAASLDLLRLGGDFDEADRQRVVERLDKLNRRLKKFPADGTDIHLTCKDRDSTGQKVTLELWLPKFGHFAATSTEADMRAALMDVREDMWRQIDDAVNKRKGN
ncbi:MAG TPA: HPF/RaiA family ribosome-associated protein [Egibacteraceae bacterium]|nr:HPF/RaiA family ribosome-associated protein [Egibacteraceae bacterium]